MLLLYLPIWNKNVYKFLNVLKVSIYFSYARGLNLSRVIILFRIKIQAKNYKDIKRIKITSRLIGFICVSFFVVFLCGMYFIYLYFINMIVIENIFDFLRRREYIVYVDSRFFCVNFVAIICVQLLMKYHFTELGCNRWGMFSENLFLFAEISTYYEFPRFHGNKMVCEKMSLMF